LPGGAGGADERPQTLGFVHLPGPHALRRSPLFHRDLGRGTRLRSNPGRRVRPRRDARARGGYRRTPRGREHRRQGHESLPVRPELGNTRTRHPPRLNPRIRLDLVAPSLARRAPSMSRHRLLKWTWAVPLALAMAGIGAGGVLAAPTAWLAVDGGLRFNTLGGSTYDWANSGSGAPTYVCPAGAVNLSGPGGLFNCGRPG